MQAIKNENLGTLALEIRTKLQDCINAL